jgi:SSS family solute:Na+ symporter
MGYVTLILTVLMVLVSLATARPGDVEKALRWDREDFRPGDGFVVGSVLVMGVLAALYAVYW